MMGLPPPDTGVQAKIIGIDGGYNSDPEYIPPPPSL